MGLPLTVAPAIAAIAGGSPLTAVAPVTRVSLTTLLSSAGGNAGDVQALVDLLRSGDAVKARVIETRADGVSLIELATTRVAIRLASAHAPGDVLNIILDEATAPAADSTPTAAPEVKLSAAAKLLGDIKNSSLNQIVTESTVTTAPMADATTTPTDLARNLQYAVRTSGLFYESHLRGWVDGHVPLAQIFEEPQARVTEASAASTARQDSPAAVHPQLEHLVRQQLDTFAHQSIAWRGEVWPDQPADIVIQGEPVATEGGTKSWRIHLATDLPALGTVVADIALCGRKIDVRLQGEPAAIDTLRAARTDLAHALAAHQLEVHPIRVADAA